MNHSFQPRRFTSLQPIFALVCFAAVPLVGFSQDDQSQAQIASNAESSIACEDCHRIRYFELSATRDPDGTLQWVEVAPFVSPDPPVRPATGDMATVVVECRTTSTNEPPFSGRKTCSDSEIHRLPADHVFVENEVRKSIHSSIGDTSVTVTFEDRVEIVPGTGIMMARTMRVSAHARSPSDTGARGHIHATVQCRFVKYR